MKPNNIIFITVSLIFFCVLSVVSFVYANGDYSGDFIFIYCLASFLFLISFVGMIFPKKMCNLLMRIGNKLLSASVYYDDMIVGTERGYRTFNRFNNIISVISNILLVVLIIIVLA